MEKSTFGVEDSAVFDLSSDGKLMAIIGKSEYYITNTVKFLKSI